MERIKLDVTKENLFEKLGGEEIINKISGTLFDKIMQSKQIRHYFITNNISKLTENFSKFI